MGGNPLKSFGNELGRFGNTITGGIFEKPDIPVPGAPPERITPDNDPAVKLALDNTRKKREQERLRLAAAGRNSTVLTGVSDVNDLGSSLTSSPRTILGG